MLKFEKLSGKGLRHYRELVKALERIMTQGMRFLGVPVRTKPQQFTKSGTIAPLASRHAPSHQHWEIHMGSPGFCTVAVGSSNQRFPLVQCSVNTDSGITIIKFTVPNSQVRETTTRYRLRLHDGDIFGGVVEWKQRGEGKTDFTVLLHPELVQMTEQQGAVVSYVFDVPTNRYRRDERQDDGSD